MEWKLKMLLNMQKVVDCRPVATIPVPEWPQAAAIVYEQREAGCAVV